MSELTTTGDRALGRQEARTINATRVTVLTFGVVAGIAGIEHGVGEVLQGNVAPAGLVILSWPESELFEILAGEPALTVIPNLLVAGALAILLSVIFLVWATVFIHRKNGGLILLLLSIVMLLVGAGFGPPVLGIILSAAATKINSPLSWWRTHLSVGSRRFLGDLWPWSFTAGIIAWLLLLPGSVILAQIFGADNPNINVPIITFSAFGLLLLTIFTGFAHDTLRQTHLDHVPLISGLPERS